MPFGLVSAPASFQHILQQVLKEHLGKSCVVYIDDIIIFGRDEYEHDENFANIMNTLRKNGLKASPSKFVFRQQSVKFLGHVITNNGIKADPDKVKCIDEWPLPTMMKELTRFIGFANYYRKFVLNFSTIIAPLEEASNKAKHMRKAKLNWTEKMRTSFKLIKKALCETAVLHCPNKKDTFILDTDASKTGIGAVLSQIDQNGKEKAVYFASNKLSKTEQNYCATRKELLAVVKYVDFFYHYLIGKKFLIRTDHRSLKWLLSWKTPTTAQYFSWISKLQQFDFEIVYREGKNHINADALSRLDFCNKCKTDHAPKLATMTAQNTTNESEVNIVKTLIAENSLPLSSAPKRVHQLWKIRNRLLLRNNQLFLKENGHYRTVLSHEKMLNLLKLLHRTTCHTGSNKLYSAVCRNYFCFGLKELCLKVTQSCLICLKRKSCAKSQYIPGNLKCSEIFEKLFIDVAGPLPTSNGYRYILVMVDGFSAFPTIVPLQNIQGADIKKAIFNKWITSFGAPKFIHSDNARYFSSPEVKNLCATFNINQSFSSPFYPQGNGKVERIIGTIKDMMYCATTEKKAKWNEVIFEIETALRSAVQPTTGLSPYEIVFGKSIKTNADYNLTFKSLTNNQMKEVVEKIYNDGSKEEKDRLEDIKVESKVMIRILPKEKSIVKGRYEGPYKVTGIKSKGNVIIVENNKGNEMVRNRKHVKLIPSNIANALPTTNIDAKQYVKKETLSDEETRLPRYPSRFRRPVIRLGQYNS